MHLSPTEDTTVTEERARPSSDELHSQASRYIVEANQLIFQDLPLVLAQIIEQEVWNERDHLYKNFGEYALQKGPDGLGITNNDMLSLLKSAMNLNTKHSPHWADVLSEVDTTVRSYAKENKISIRDLNRELTEPDNTNPEQLQENIITYLPSRSKSLDGQLMKLKAKDPQAYQDVIQGKMNMKEAWSQVPKKKVHPVESVKNKFASLSKSDREAFLEWLEQEKENLV